MNRTRCAVVGAANIDLGGFPDGPLARRDSNPGRVTMSAGGVGRNIACNLARLGVETHLVAALGGDAFADILRADCARAGVRLDLALAFPDAASSAYLYIADGQGDMALAVNDMSICARLTPEALETRVGALNAMDAVVLDANLPGETLEYLAGALTAPLIADAVSAAKARRLLPILPRLALIKPNALEAEALTGISIREPGDAEEAGRRLAAMGARQAFITLGARGVCIANGDGARTLAPPRLERPVNATGAGDAFTAALVWALLNGRADPEEAALAGMAAAAICMESPDTVNPAMRAETLEKRMRAAKQHI